MLSEAQSAFFDELVNDFAVAHEVQYVMQEWGEHARAGWRVNVRKHREETLDTRTADRTPPHPANAKHPQVMLEMQGCTQSDCKTTNLIARAARSGDVERKPSQYCATFRGVSTPGRHASLTTAQLLRSRTAYSEVLTRFFLVTPRKSNMASLSTGRAAGCRERSNRSRTSNALTACSSFLKPAQSLKFSTAFMRMPRSLSAVATRVAFAAAKYAAFAVSSVLSTSPSASCLHQIAFCCCLRARLVYACRW